MLVKAWHDFGCRELGSQSEAEMIMEVIIDTVNLPARRRKQALVLRDMRPLSSRYSGTKQ